MKPGWKRVALPFLHLLPPPLQTSITGPGQRAGGTAGKKNRGMIKLGRLKREMLWGIFRTERRPLGLFSFAVLSSLLCGQIWGWVCLLVWEACLALKNEEGPGCGPGKESQRLLRPDSGLNS